MLVVDRCKSVYYPFPVLSRKVYCRDVHIADDLHTADKTEITQLLQTYSDVLTYIKSVITATSRVINVSDIKAMRSDNITSHFITRIP